MLSKRVLTASLVASVAGTIIASDCQFQVEDTIAVGIHQELELFMGVPDEAVHILRDTFKVMDFNINPDSVDDIDPPYQKTMFSVMENLGDKIFFGLGFETGGEYIGYDPTTTSLYWRPAGVYDPEVEQRLQYQYSPITGDSVGASVGSGVYDPRERGWYSSAVDACSVDLEGTYACPTVVWSDFFVFAGTGNLGITPSIAVPDYANNDKSVRGVIGLGYYMDDINDILEDSVSGNTIAYLMESDGMLIATSNGVPTATEANDRINAQNSVNADISSSSTFLLTNHYKSDQTVINEDDDQIITVKTFIQDSLQWYIVVVEEMNDSMEDCEAELEQDLLALVKGDLNGFLEKTGELCGLIEKAMDLNIISYSPPTEIDQENGLQDLMFGAIKNFPTLRSAYVGFEDGTFFGYLVDLTYVGLRKGDGAADTTRYFYYADDETGKSTSGEVISRAYDPRGRTWYQSAKADGTGHYSEIYGFATGGALGITYSVPIYNGDTFIGVVGADFKLDEVDAILAEFGSNGVGVYVTETSDSRGDADQNFDIVATSSHAKLVNETGSPVQFKAYNIEGVEDYYIANSAAYMRDNYVTTDGSTFSDDGYTASVATYDAYTLNWRLVSYEVEYTNDDDDTDADSSSSNNADDDDETETIIALTSVIFVFLIIGLGLLIYIVFTTCAANKDEAANGNKQPNVEMASTNPLAARVGKEDITVTEQA